MSLPRSHLPDLLGHLDPRLHEGTYAFAVLPEGREAAGLPVVATLQEAEGLTVVLPEAVAAREGFPCLFRAAWITLTVHSDLQAVGLTAAVAGALAGAGISCNILAGAFHDHLFVPAEAAQAALAVLRELQRGAAIPSGGPA